MKVTIQKKQDERHTSITINTPVDSLSVREFLRTQVLCDRDSLGHDVQISVGAVNFGEVVSSEDVSSFVSFLKERGISTPDRDIYEDWLISRVSR